MECEIFCTCCNYQHWNLSDLKFCLNCGIKCRFCLSITLKIGNCSKCKSKSKSKSKSQNPFYCNKCYICPNCNNDLQPSIKTIKDTNGKIFGKKVKFKCDNCHFKFNTEILETPKPLGEFVWDSIQTSNDLRFNELANAMENIIEGKPQHNIQILPIDNYEIKKESLKPIPKKLPIFHEDYQCLNCLKNTIDASFKIPKLIINENNIEFINKTNVEIQIQIGQIDNWNIPLESIIIPPLSNKLIPINGEIKTHDLDVVLNTINNCTGIKYKIIV